MIVEANNNEALSPDTTQPKPGWRIKLGFTMFIAALVWPVLLPILPLFGLSTQSVAAFTGFMLVAAEVVLILAAAISGKDGFAYIKKRVFGFFKSYGPPQVVSATRYKIGLVFFVVPFLFGFGSPYVGHLFPGLDIHKIAYAVAGDILLLAGLFILGGNFWDKLRSLFLHKAVAVMPDSPSAK
jgi:hypothetical protein